MRKFLLGVWELRRGLVAICLLVVGAYQLYVGIAFRHPRVIAYRDFVKTMPSLGWYHLKDVPLAYDRSVGRHTDRSSDAGRYIPAIDSSGCIHVLVMAYEDTEPGTGPAHAIKDIDGTVESGLDQSEKLSSDVRPLQSQLVVDYRVIDEGQTPHLALGIIFGALGLVLGTLVLAYSIAVFARSRA